MKRLTFQEYWEQVIYPISGNKRGYKKGVRDGFHANDDYIEHLEKKLEGKSRLIKEQKKVNESHHKRFQNLEACIVGLVGGLESNMSERVYSGAYFDEYVRAIQKTSRETLSKYSETIKAVKGE